MLVIQIAGTSGSGKSTTVRRIFDTPGANRETNYILGRKAPIGYVLELPGVAKACFVAGAYEAPTGGCDTIKDIEQVMTLVANHHKLGYHVLFEGLFCMNHTRGPALARQCGVANFQLVRLTTDIKVCSTRIDQRRAAKGEGPLVERGRAENARKNIEGGHTRAGNYAAKMSFLGVKVHRTASEDAPELILGLLRSAT
jgi:predicted kinase